MHSGISTRLKSPTVRSICVWSMSENERETERESEREREREREGEREREREMSLYLRVVHVGAPFPPNDQV